MGAKVVWRICVRAPQPNVHDPLKLAAAYNEAFELSS